MTQLPSQSPKGMPATRSWRRTVAGAVVGGAVAVALGSGLAATVTRLGGSELLSSRLFGAGLGSPANSARAVTARSMGRRPLGKDAQSDHALVDAILSTVQGYYVDAGRVDGLGLVDAAVEALRTNGRIQAGRSRAAAWVEIDGERRLFPLRSRSGGSEGAQGDEVLFQDLVAYFSGVGQMLTAVGIELESADGGYEAAGSPSGAKASATAALLNATLAALDAHSALLSPDAYRELRQGTDGAFGGLGVLVGMRDHLLTVVRPLPRSPAARAGIRAKDKILAIDATHTFGMTLEQLVDTMRGEAGSEVKLTLLRDGALAPAVLKLRREVVQVDSVTDTEVKLPSGAPALRLAIESFASRTSREVIAAIKRHRLKHGGQLPGLVLDLRGNPGGLLDQAVQVADLFLPEGVIVTTRGRREEVETAGGGYDEVGFPLVVLIDSDSASASEIVAGALKDHHRAVVIGQPSFGKGSVQTIFELPNERALKLTIARYFTPAGISIQNVGIMPDIWLQPVFRAGANENLLGVYRYKNEGFLRHHLEVEGRGESGEAAGAPLPLVKSYYLASQQSLAADPGFGERGAPDHELELARAIIGKVRSIYGTGVLPKAADRSSHWLALTSATISGYVTAIEKEARSWLSATHKVEWRSDPASAGTVKLSLDLAPGAGAMLGLAAVAKAGGNVEIPWHLANRGDHSIPRVSLFVRGENLLPETRETLVGTIPPRGQVSGSIVVPIPPDAEAQTIQLRVGVAVDAWPLKELATDYSVRIDSRLSADLAVASVLLDEVGGTQPGVLEPRERATVAIDLSNVSAVIAHKVKVKIVNLSGEQLRLGSPEIPPFDLFPGENRRIGVDVLAGRQIYSREIHLGIYVESADLKKPFSQRLAIKSQQNGVLSKAASPPAMSH